MADAFIGSKVSVLLQSGIKLEGTISDIEPTTQLMTLKHVLLFIANQPPHQTPVYGVYGKDIKDLQVLSAPQVQQQVQNQQQAPSSNINNSGSSPTASAGQQQAQQRPQPPQQTAYNNHLLEHIPPTQPRKESSSKTLETLARSSSSSSKLRNNSNTNRKSRQQQPTQYQQVQHSFQSRRHRDNGWAKEDVEVIKEEEFDFQKNLDMFDKEKVFAEIREADETAQEDLLVTINRLPQKKHHQYHQQQLLQRQQKKQINLLPTENVLDSSCNNDDDDEDDADDDDYFEEDESDNDDSETQDEFTRTTSTTGIATGTAVRKRVTRADPLKNGKRLATVLATNSKSSKGNNSSIRSKEKKQQQLVASKKTTTTIVTKGSDIVCSTVSPLQMARVEHECLQVSHSFDDLIIENGGRGAASLILQILSKTDIVSPSITVLVGNTKKGALGLVAARHLINHGCSVTVCMITASGITKQQQEDSLSDRVRPYYNILAASKQKQTSSNKSDRVDDDVNITFKLDVSSSAAPDLIVDAMLGVEDKIVDMQDSSYYDEFCNAIQWANSQPKPILSIEFPSGIDAGTGIPYHPEHMMHPKWTLCLGAPLSGCKSSNVTGDLFLADIGIPKLCWRKVGMKGNTIPWCADFLVALEYNTTV